MRVIGAMIFPFLRKNLDETDGSQLRKPAVQRICIYVCLIMALAGTARTSWAGWDVKPSGTANTLFAVHFPVDGTTGYAVGAAGTILKTVDGAETWSPQTSGTANALHGVHFPVDATTGYVIGDGGVILKTVDGGVNWIPQTSGTVQPLQAVHFPVDALTGFAVGPGLSVFKTTDGGVNWISQPTGNGSGLFGVHFPTDATTGYAVGSGETILKTIDGGSTWSTVRSGPGALQRDVHFPMDATTGYSVGMSGSILKTMDGGSAWTTPVSGTSEHLFGVHFPADTTTGYIVGDSGTILRTEDGGAHWVPQSSGTANGLWSVQFPAGGSVGFAVGDLGTILKTTNGGGDQIALHPTGDGATSQFVPAFCASLWDCVNDQTGNAGAGVPEDQETGTYISGDNGQRAMFSLDNGVVPVDATITSITIFAQVWRGSGSGANISLSYQRMPGATSSDPAPVDAPGLDLPSSCCTALINYTWNDLLWTRDDLDNLEIGLVHNGGTSTLDATQMYVYVTYDGGAANTAPFVALAIPDTTVTEDNAPIADYRDLNEVFDDIEDGSALTFSLQSNSNPGLVTATIDAGDSTLDFTFAPNQNGSATIVIRATDSGALSVNDTLVVTVTPTFDILGRVFDDAVVNGSVGEPFNGGEGDAGIPGARVELFDASDVFQTFTTTGVSGNYTFANLDGGTTYTVRVVAATLDAGIGVLPEQTFESDGSTDYGSFGTAMGGSDPVTPDTTAFGTLSGAEHRVSVAVGAAEVIGVDFGFSYEIVVNTNDSDQGSFRRSLENAIAIAGVQTTHFNIPTTDPNYTPSPLAYTIQPLSPLPEITDPTVVDGTTQPDFVATPIVVLDGTQAGAGARGVWISAGGCAVRGLVINRFTASGIHITTGGGNTIEGNYIGVDVTGLLDRGNGSHGIHIDTDTGGNTIGGVTLVKRNVISSNAGHGIYLQASSANTILNNYIGADKNGATLLGNGGHGILIGAGDDNTIGGTAPGEGNLISGNVGSGVVLAN